MLAIYIMCACIVGYVGGLTVATGRRHVRAFPEWQARMRDLATAQTIFASQP